MSKAAELANLIGNINAGGGGVNRNIVINGAMNVAQRGTSSTGIATGGYYTLDRYKIQISNTAGRFTMTQDSSAPEGFSNSMKLDCTTADTSIASDELLFIQHSIEGQNLQTLQKGTSSAVPVTASFYVKGNASATYTVELEDRDNTRYNSQEFPVTTDWVRISRTFVADTTGTLDDDNAESLRLNFWLHGGSNYTGGTHTDNVWHTTDNQRVGDGASSFFDSTDRTFFITGVQLEVGQNPTEFEHEPYEKTISKCQRYYYRYSCDGTHDGVYTVGNATDNNTAIAVITTPVGMRAEPTFGFQTGSNGSRVRTGAGSSQQVSAMSITGFSNDQQGSKFQIDATTTTNNLTTGHAAQFRVDVNDFIELDAEL